MASHYHDSDDRDCIKALSRDGIITSHTISDWLRARYLHRQRVARFGSDDRVVVVLNDDSARSGTVDSDEYELDEEDVRQDEFSVAQSVYANLKATAEDQSVIFSGESGSGKTEARKLFVRQLVTLSKTHKRKSKILSGAAKMEAVIESLAHAHLPYSFNASRVGRYTEYQYSSSGKMVGVKLLDFHLDKRHLTLGAHMPSGVRNFNIFYQLLAGASASLRDRLQLSSDPYNYQYLGGAGFSSGVTGGTLGRSGTLTAESISRSKSSLSRKGTLTRAFSLKRKGTVGKNSSVAAAAAAANPVHHLTPSDTENFDMLCSHLKSLGIGERAQSQFFQVVAAILHLGNITFVSDPDTRNEACTVKNVAALNAAADLLGVDPTHLETALTYKTKLVKREVCSILLDVNGAEQQRDALARALYSGMFAWLVEHLNKRLCKPEAEFDQFVAVVDFPGSMKLPNSTAASFDDFMRNYATERLLRLVQLHAYEFPRAALETDGINVSVPPFLSNEPNFALIAGGPPDNNNGILPILQEVSLHPDESDYLSTGRFTETLNETFNGHPAYIPTQKCPSVMATTSSTPSHLSNVFGIVHHFGIVTYNAADFISRNREASDADFVTLFRGITTEQGHALQAPSRNAFASYLFSSGAGMTTETLEGRGYGGGNVVSAKRQEAPLRRPSIKRKAGATQKGQHVDKPITTASKGFVEALEEVLDVVKGTKLYSVFCIRPMDPVDTRKLGGADFHGGFDAAAVRRQIDSMAIAGIAKFFSCADVGKGMEYDEFCRRYAALIQRTSPHTHDDRTNTIELLRSRGWTIDNSSLDIKIGRSKIFLSDVRWRMLDSACEDQGMAVKTGSDTRIEAARPGTPAASSSTESEKPDSDYSYGSTVALATADAKRKQRSRHSSGTSLTDVDEQSETDSVYGLEFDFPGNSFNKRMSSAYADLEMGKVRPSNASGFAQHPHFKANEWDELPKTKKTTSARRQWVCLTWCLTWWIPSCCLSRCGGMKRPDMRMAWREKTALFTIIIFIILALLFFIIGLNWVICPPQRIRTLDEVQSMSSDKNPWVAAHGKYYNIKDLMQFHLRSFGTGPAAIHDYDLSAHYGQDVSNLFFRTDYWDVSCAGFPKPQEGWDIMPDVDDGGPFRSRPVDKRALHRAAVDGFWSDYLGYMNQWARGRIGWSMERLEGLRSNEKIYSIIYSNVYYLTPYFRIQNRPFPAEINTLFEQASSGLDLTTRFERFRAQNPELAAQTLQCMNSMFYVGTLDTRNTIECQFTNWILVAASIILASVIGFKFFAALQFRKKQEPEPCDKFVICLVTAYTEGAEELEKTIESIAVNRYDDRRKLLFIVADGMIVGSGNDRPTPQIILDILGVDTNRIPDPTPLAFQSLGAGSKQLNYAKIYTGLYQIKGHSVPFVVCVKVGAPHERVKPGNRGKRDSQLVLMRWLNRVHHEGSLMTPLERELCYVMREVIGVEPAFYEYVLMVDADTRVEDRAVNRLISYMVDDSKVMGLCGETRLSNEKKSWVTMIQVYEYFISHHLSKAFESLFGTVTCLPGCFCLYRVRGAGAKKEPLLVSPAVLRDYSENNVETLHEKNLLHLGEDRYLTTLMLKHFPNMRTSFTRAAQCTTTAPERWSVLLSQRRRWINSTVHNLMELVTLRNLCGFCCFSMRFIVMIDLLATFVQPAVVLYLVYLIYALASGGGALGFGGGPDEGRAMFPMISLILIGVIYGLQVIIFILRRQWQHIVWMIIYLLALPVFSFYIPLYAFWHFDDFSWGNTRVVRSEGGTKKKVVTQNEGTFDPSMVPMARYEDSEFKEKSSARMSGYWDDGIDNGRARYSASIAGYTAPAPASTYAGSVYGGTTPMAVSPSPTAPPLQLLPPIRRSSSSFADSSRLSFMVSPTSPTPTVMPTAYQLEPYQSPSGRDFRSSFLGPSDNKRSSFLVPSPRPISASNLEEPHPIDPSHPLLPLVRQILASHSLDTLTRKQLRQELSSMLDLDLRHRRDEINSLVEAVMDGRL
ncbi:chitin synthase-domain-containing protein [Gaertneriomyces semiglobifer]|nr:chitin synthase-domain-containing protein [Gaertneriomyces semiglobifer]